MDHHCAPNTVWLLKIYRAALAGRYVSRYYFCFIFVLFICLFVLFSGLFHMRKKGKFLENISDIVVVQVYSYHFGKTESSTINAHIKETNRKTFTNNTIAQASDWFNLAKTLHLIKMKKEFSIIFVQNCEKAFIMSRWLLEIIIFNQFPYRLSLSMHRIPFDFILIF